MDLDFTSDCGHVLHPAARMVAPDEAYQILEFWLEQAWRAETTKENTTRFLRLVQIKSALDWPEEIQLTEPWFGEEE